MAERNPRGMARITLYIFLAISVLALLFFVLRTIITFPAKSVLHIYYYRWIFLTTVGNYIEAMIPLSMTAVLLSFSLFGTDRLERSGNKPFYRFIGSVLILFLALTLVYAILQEGVRPSVYSSKDGILYITERARDYLEKADEGTRTGNFEDAVVNLESYLEIDPENEEKRQELSSVASRIRPEAPREEEPPAAKSRLLLSNLTAADLLDKAREFLEKEDLFSAHYYATMAYQVDPTYTEARRLAAVVWDRIGEVEAHPEDSETYSLFKRKKTAYTALQEERFVDAYYLFKAITADYPRDPDIRKYMEIAQEKAMGVSFFVDDARKALTLAGTRNILFLNRRTDTERELIYIDKLVMVREGTFAHGIEAIGFTPEGRITYHLTAEYGKIIDTALVMQCIHRENKAINFLPRYIRGSRPGMERYSIPLLPPIDALPGFSLAPGALGIIDIPELWNIGKNLIAYGFRGEPLYQELLIRLLLPFTFLLANLYMAALGWRMRIRFGRFRILSLILLLLLPIITSVILDVYLYANKLLVGYLLIATTFWTTAGILLGIQVLLLFFALLSLAGQTTE